MAQIAVLSAQVEIKSPAGMFYGFFKDKVPQLPQIFPEAVKSFKFLEGSEIRDGAVIWAKYDLGSIVTAKARIEVNDSSKSVSFVILDGDVLKHYKSFTVKYQVNGGGFVRATLEFEKARESSPSPDGYIDLVSKIIKRFDHLSRS